MILLLLLSCWEPTEAEPSIDLVTAACTLGELNMVILASDDNVVANVVVEGPETWYPIKDLDFAETGQSQWVLDDAPSDCDPFDYTVIATNVFGHETRVERSWPAPDPEGTRLEPSHGTTAGGTQVTLYGDGLTDLDSILFDGIEAEFTLDEGNAVISTPPHDAGEIEVTLVAQAATSVVADPFTYYDDAAGLVRGTGLPTLLLFDSTWFTIVSAYADTEGSFAQHELVLHEPQDASTTYIAQFPPVGGCEWGTALDSSTWGNYGDYVLVHDTWPMQPSDDNVYYLATDDLVLEDWLGVPMDIAFVDEDSTIPPQVLEGAFSLPAQPDYTSWDWQALNTLERGQPLEIDWTSADVEQVLVTVYRSSGTTSLGDFTCVWDQPFEIDWTTLMDGVDEEQVDGLHLEIVLMSNVESMFEHDDSVLWSLGRVVHFVYYSIE